jgi:hypothetical protein
MNRIVPEINREREISETPVAKKAAQFPTSANPIPAAQKKGRPFHKRVEYDESRLFMALSRISWMESQDLLLRHGIKTLRTKRVGVIPPYRVDPGARLWCSNTGFNGK